MKPADVEAPEVSRTIEKDPGEVEWDLGNYIAYSQVLKVVSIVSE